MRKLTLFVALLALVHVNAAHAYIGPGLGAGTIAVVFGILSSIFFAFVGIIWYPVKRLFRGRKASAKPAATADAKTEPSAAAIAVPPPGSDGAATAPIDPP